MSEWAETLKGSEQSRQMWTETCMKTSKHVFDAPVAAAAAAKDPGGKERQRENFHKNVVGTRLYYGDMMTEEKCAEVDAALMAVGTSRYCPPRHPTARQVIQRTATFPISNLRFLS